MTKKIVSGVPLFIFLSAVTPAFAHCELYQIANPGPSAIGALVVGSGWEMSDLRGWHFNDITSAVKIKPFRNTQCKLVVYEHIDFGGEKREFVSDEPWVGSHWNDKISSAKCVCPYVSRKCELYEHANYQGVSLPVYEGSEIQTTNTYLARFNDIVSSVKVPSGCRLTLWEHEFYGRQQTFTSDAPALPLRQRRSMDIMTNDLASSARCTCD